MNFANKKEPKTRLLSASIKYMPTTIAHKLALCYDFVLLYDFFLLIKKREWFQWVEIHRIACLTLSRDHLLLMID